MACEHDWCDNDSDDEFGPVWKCRLCGALGENCDECSGSGADPQWGDEVDCDFCDGSGVVPCEDE